VPTGDVEPAGPKRTGRLWIAIAISLLLVGILILVLFLAPVIALFDL